MREQKHISEMNDRELRAYKRRLRRQREQRRRIMSVALTLCLVIICAVSYHSIISNAKSGTEELSLKYYTGITVKSGETLWSIADDYIDYTQYKNKDTYINEICSINNLENASEIKCGQRLIIPYYSSEYIK